MIDLKNKKVLLIAPLGQYSVAIQNTMEEMGASVDCFEERPSLSFIVKLLIRYFPRLIHFYTQRYYNSITNFTKSINYDFVLMIRVEAVTKKFILDLKVLHKNSKVILYQWDSMNHTKGPIDKLPLFDYVFSFDKNDCNKYTLNFLPLFYTQDYNFPTNCNEPTSIDFLFIGTIHSDRYNFLKQIEEYAILKRMNVYFYMYLTSHTGYYKMKFIDRLLYGSNIQEFKFISLKKDDVVNLVSKSKIIVDAEHLAQLGLTMRTIETLGAKRKLITTNKDVVNYDFYNANNILVVNRENVQIPDSFIKSEYIELDKNVYTKYSVHNWVKVIFDTVATGEKEKSRTMRH